MDLTGRRPSGPSPDQVRINGSEDELARSDRSSSKTTQSASLTTSTAIRRLACGPSFDFGSKPELDAPLAEIEHGLRHIVVPLLILKDGVAVSQPEDLGYALRIEQILCRDHRSHAASLHR